MKKNRLLRLFASFTADDWRAYRDFAKGRYSDDSLYHKIYTQIRKRKDSFDPDDVDTLHLSVNPDASKKAFRNTLSRLMPHVEDFLVYQDIKMNERRFQQTLMKAMINRGLYKDYDSLLDKKISEPLLKEDLWHSLDLFQMVHDNYFSDNPNKYDPNCPLLDQGFTYLNQFYRQMKQFYNIELENRKIIYNKNEADHTTKPSHLETVLNDIYNVLHEEPDAFDRLYKMISDGQLEVSDRIRDIIVIHLTKFAWKQVHRGSITYTEKLLYLYTYNLEHSYSQSGQHIPPVRFDNIINIASMISKYEWTMQTIEQYGPLIDPAHRDDCLQIAMAQVAFSMEKYQEVISLLKDHLFQLDSHKLRQKWLLLCSTYMVDYDDQVMIYNELRSYKRFIKNYKNHFGNSVTAGSLTLARYIEKMLKREDKTKLLTALEAEPFIIFQIWLKRELGRS